MKLPVILLLLVLGCTQVYADRRCDSYRGSRVSVSISSGPAYPYHRPYYHRPYYHRPYYSQPVVVRPYPTYRYYAPTTVPVYRGSQPSDVTERVQLSLARKGYYDGEIDGVMGPGTRAAIRAYQMDRGLPISSTIDGSLVRALGIN